MYILNHPASTQWPAYLAGAGRQPRQLQQGFRAQLTGVHPAYAPVMFPPPLFDAQQVGRIVQVSQAMLKLIESIPERLFGGDYRALMAYQGMAQDDIDFLLNFTNPRHIAMATAFARPDVLLTEDGFQFVEVNVAPPIGGLGICDRVRSAFSGDPYCAFLRARGVACAAPHTGTVWGRCMRTLARRAARLARPTFFEATADPGENLGDDFTQPDFAALVADSGFRLITGPIQQLEVRADGVFYRGERIDIVFTCFTCAESRRFVPRALLRALAQADLREVVDFIAPPLSAVFDNKINFEILSSAAFSHRFNAAERALIERHVPRTRRLSAALLEQVAGDPAGYVLKPASEYGGIGVVIGAAVGAAAWRAALEQALASGELYIVQDTITRPYLWRGGEAGTPHSMCLGPMLFGHAYAGTLLRHAPYGESAPVINCAQGAYLGTVFTAEALPRHLA